MWVEISVTEFSRAIAGMVTIASGEMFGGGWYIEHAPTNGHPAEYRQDVRGEVVKRFKFEPSTRG